MEEELEDGKFRSVSCPETRCPTPKNPHVTPDKERGSTTDLIAKKSTSTYDRISGNNQGPLAFLETIQWDDKERTLNIAIRISSAR